MEKIGIHNVTKAVSEIETKNLEARHRNTYWANRFQFNAHNLQPRREKERLLTKVLGKQSDCSA